MSMDALKTARRPAAANLLVSYVLPVALIVIWIAVLLGLPAYLPLQPASWLAFLALMITPGYLLGEMLAWRLNLDVIERLALAFSLGMFALAIPGLLSDILHVTVTVLTVGWIATAGIIIFAWLVFAGIRLRSALEEPGGKPWKLDEIALLLLIGAAFLVMFPLLQLFRLDGDTYAFTAFVSDALSGLPLVKLEPYFGTTIAATVRLVFDQVLPMSILWAQFAQHDELQIAATASRAMIAVWSIMATYMLGKTAARGNRRLGLLAAAVQIVIYLAAPFLRTDNVSSFFFQRTTTDKFLVPVVMLPVLMALAIRFIRDGDRRSWIVAALVTFAISAIHPLIALMAALGLSAFGGLHLLFNLRSRIAWRRVWSVAALVVLVMGIPLVQFVIARVQTPFAPTYPTSFDGWQIGQKMSPIAPFSLLRSKDQYGPLPTLDNAQPAQALTNTSPFLVWRFASNMRQQRIVLFGLHRYILDPTYVLEPPFILAFLMLLFFLPRLKRSLAAQFVTSNMLVVILVMFNPWLTPIIGALVIPWIMWRMIWMMPYALSIALGLFWAVQLLGRAVGRAARSVRLGQAAAAALPVVFVLASAGMLLPQIRDNINNLNNAGPSQAYATPFGVLNVLQQDTTKNGPGMVIADQGLSVVIAAYDGKASILAHRSLTTSETFPAAMQDVALKRLIDQNKFFESRYLTDTTLAIIKEYDARYIVTTSGSDLDLQLRLAPQWFQWQVDDQGYSLYVVKQQPTVTESIQGNIAMAKNDWQSAQADYQAALKQNPKDLLALYGLAEAYRVQGEFDLALQVLTAPQVPTDSLALHYELGHIYSQAGDAARSIAELQQVQAAAPNVDRFHQAMGDECLGTGQLDCARQKYAASAAIDWPAQQAQQLITEGKLWVARDRADIGIPLYVQAVALQPSKANRLQLASVYESQKIYDKAQAVLDALHKELPTDYEVVQAMAGLAAAQGHMDQATPLYNRAIWLEELKMRDTTDTRLALAQDQLTHGQDKEAYQSISDVLNLQSYNASAYTLLGNLYRDQQQPELAIQAYNQALKLDPSEVLAYISLSGQYNPQPGATTDPVAVLQQGAQANPDQVSLFIQLGDQLARRGDSKSAISSYQLALQLLDPNQLAPGVGQRKADGTRALAYIRLATVYEDQGDLKAAMNYYFAAASASPTDAGARVALGDALRRRNDIAAAEQAYRQAMKVDPSYVNAYIRLGDLLSAEGKGGQVTALYNQAIAAAQAGSDKRQEARILLGVGRSLSQTRQPPLGLNSDDTPIQTAGGSVVDPATASALDAYNQALQTDESLATLTALAQLYEQLGQPDKAIQVFRAQIQSGLDQNWTASRLSRYFTGLGIVYQDVGQLDMAQRAYSRAISLDGWASTPRVRLGEVMSDQGDKAGALKQLQQAVQVAPGSVEAQVALANALTDRGQQSEALTIYKSAYNAHPGDALANLALARALQQRDQWQQAEATYRHAMTLSPGDTQAYVGLANLYVAEAHFQQAEALLRQAMGVDRSNIATYVSLGSLLARQAKYDQATTIYNQALHVSTTDFRVYIGLADVQYSMGQVDQAIASLQKAAGVNLNSPDPLIRLANIYSQQGQLDQAEQALLAATVRSTGDVNARIALANLYTARGMNDEAMLQLRRAVRENPGSVQALVAYANELRQRGRINDAEQLYKQAESSGKATAAGYRTLALARSAEGQSDQAMALIDKALALDPQDPQSWITKGSLLAQRQDGNGALAAYRQATVAGPGEGQAWQALGDALLNAGQPKDAVVALKQAIAVDPTFLPSYNSLVDAEVQAGQTGEVTATLQAAQQAVPGSYLPYQYAAAYDQTRLLWTDAQTALQESITKAPGVTDSYLRLGDLLAREGLYQTAITGYNQATQLGLADFRLYLGTADAYNSLGQFDQVAPALRRAASASVTSPQPLIRLAAFDRERNHPDQAEQALLRAEQRFPGDLTVRTALASLYQSMGRSQDALTQLKLAVDENPNSIQAIVAYAQALRLQAQGDAASAMYQKADQLGANHPADYRSLVQALQADGRLQDALNVIDRAIAAAPGQPADWMLKGQLETRLGNQQAAVDAYKHAVALNPGDGRSGNAYGRALLNMGRTQDAINVLTAAINGQPTYLPSYDTLYQAYHDAGQQDKADQVALQAQQIVPGSYVGDVLVARSFQDQQKWDQARAALDQAIKKAPGVPQPLMAVGDLERVRGENGQALAAYNQAAALRPGDTAASTALIDFQLEQGANDQALASTQKALAVQPGDLQLLLRLGRAQQALGHQADAEAAFIKAAGLNPYEGQPLAELAALYVIEGRPEQAIASYQKALGAQPFVASYYLGIAQVWSSQAQSDNAIKALQEGVGRASRPAGLYALMSSIYLQQAKPDLALQVLQQGIKQQGEDAQLLLALGSYYRSRADFSQAEQTYQHALQLYPGDFTVHAALGDFYQNRGRLTEALNEYQKAVALQVNRPSVYMALGDVQTIAGDSGQASATYAQAMTLAPAQEDVYANLAALYRQQGRFDQAQQVYQNGLALIPSSAKLMSQYADLLAIDLGQVDGGVAMMDKAVQLSPNATTLVDRADLYRQLGQFDNAMRDLKTALAVSPGSSDALITLGDVYQARGDVVDAQQAYRQAVAVAPGVAGGYLGLADLANLQGRMAEAQTDYRAAQAAQPSSADAFLRLATARTGWGDQAGAEAAYRQALAVSPLSVQAYIGLATLEYRRIGDLGTSLSYLSQAQKLGVQQAQVYRAIGDLYMAAGRSGQALGFYQEAVRREPGSVDGPLGLSSYYLAVGLPGDAVREAQQAVKMAPHSAPAELALGNAYWSWGNTAQAGAAFQAAIKLAPTQVGGYTGLAAMDASLKQWAGAIAAYQNAIKLAPLNPSLWVELGNVYAQAQQFNNAYAAFDKAAAMNPTLPDPYLARGDAYQLQANYAAAQAAFKQAQALRPRDPTALLRLAGLALAQQDYGTAAGDAQQALALNPRSATAYSLLGSAQAGLGQPAQAIASYTAALRLDPRQTDAYSGWIRQQLGTDTHSRNFAQLQGALAAVANGPDAGSEWAQVLLGLGYERLDQSSLQGLTYLQKASGQDPAYADLYQSLATAYEAQLIERPALAAWYRFVYAAGTTQDVTAARARIVWLQNGSISAPSSGSTVSGDVQIRGTASRENFWYYKVEFAPAGTQNWSAIGGQAYQPVTNGLLIVWHTAGLPAGQYQVRLIVVDKTGNYGPYDVINVTVR